MRHPITGERKSIYGYSEAELAANVRAFLGLAPEPQDDTFGSYYFDVYLASVANRSQSWLNQIAGCMDKYFLPEYGHRDIKSITRAELQRSFNSWRLSDSTKAKYKIVVSGVFNLAVVDEVVSRNPCTGVRLVAAAAPNKTALTPAQLWALYNAAAGRTRILVAFGGFLGLRFGEALGASRTSLSKEGVFTVERQVLQFTRAQAESIPLGHYEERRGGAVLTRKLKTPQSVRKIPVPKQILELLRSVDRHWLISDDRGQWALPNNLERDLAAAVAAAQKADPDFPRVTMHELRHTWLTIMESQLECPDSIRLELAGKKKQGSDADYLHPHMERKRHWQERYWEVVSTSAVVKGVVKLA